MAYNAGILNPSLVRHNNYRSILLTIRDLGACTVSQIAAQIPLSKTAIAKGISHLLDLGFILAVGKEASSSIGGKPAELYTINPASRFCCVLVYDDNILNISIFDFLGERIWKQDISPQEDLDLADAEAVASNISTHVIEGTRANHFEASQLYGVIFVPGHGFIRKYYKHSAQQTALKDAIRRHLEAPVPVHIEYLKDMFGYAELRKVPRRKQETIAVVSISRNEINGTIIDHGRILKGHHGAVADFAHVTTQYENGKMCTCGRRGCYQTAVLQKYILEDITETLSEGAESSLQQILQERPLKFTDFLDAVESGDVLAAQYSDSMQENHFNLIYSIYLILHPHEIIIQTGKRYYEKLWPELEKRLSSTKDPLHGGFIRMRLSAGTYSPEEAAPIGAADFCIDQFLNDPHCFE